jgi:hypothetical protein
MPAGCRLDQSGVGLEGGIPASANERLEVHGIRHRAVSAKSQARYARDPQLPIGAEIGRYYRGRRKAEAAEQNRVGVVFEDVAAAVEDFEVTFQ